MTEINRHNYEIYCMDYLDGNLSPSQEELLWLFLKENPDLKQELEEFESIHIPSHEQEFPGKQQLKKSILLDENQSSIFDELCISYIEGDLSLKGKAALNEYLNSNPQKAQALKIYKQTKFQADSFILFPEKEKLKKTGMIFAMKRFYPYIAVAASILLLIAVYLFVPQKSNESYSTRVAVFETLPARENLIQLELEGPQALPNLSTPLAEAKKYPTPAEEKKHQPIPAEGVRDSESLRITAIDPLPLKPIEQERNPLHLASVESGITNKTLDYFQAQYSQEPGYKNLTSFLAESVSERWVKTPENGNKKFELFDLARWSVQGVNWLTGSNMTLEKQYNQKGEAEKINFNSKLIAFSTPINEK
ncbi:MAG: hypothetical protein ACQESQ_05745 [Bacteroidota bacterium]